MRCFCRTFMSPLLLSLVFFEKSQCCDKTVGDGRGVTFALRALEIRSRKSSRCFRKCRRSKDDADLVVSTNTDKLCAKTFREYNPELLAKHFQKQPFKVLKRMYEIVSSMTSWAYGCILKSAIRNPGRSFLGTN